MRKIISHSAPHITDREIDSVITCLKSGQIKGGPEVQNLEKMIANYFNMKGAVATTNCTQAIHMTLRGIFPKGGARIGFSTYLCRSVYDAVILSNCKPVLFDIDPVSLAIDPEQLKKLNYKDKLDAVIVAHIAGIRAPFEKLKGNDFIIIEDCAQRLPNINSKSLEPEPDIKVLSFEATKLITGGEGGIILSNNIPLISRILNLRDAPYSFHEPACWFPLTDIQASIIKTQWDRLSELLDRRAYLARWYIEEFNNYNIIHPAMLKSDTFHFRFLLKLQNTDEFISFCYNKDVVVRRPIAPLPIHKLFNISGQFNNSEQAMKEIVSIPFYPSLTDKESEKVIKVIKEFLI